MSSHVVFFGWNRPLPGRETMSGQHFQEFLEYLANQQRSGLIESYEPVLLVPHGSEMNGFILIRGEGAKLGQLLASEDWTRHQLRSTLHTAGIAVVRGVTGSEVGRRMALWMQEVPK